MSCWSESGNVGLREEAFAVDTVITMVNAAVIWTDQWYFQILCGDIHGAEASARSLSLCRSYTYIIIMLVHGWTKCVLAAYFRQSRSC